MPNCCQGATCACKLSAETGGHVTITGSGSIQDPFMLSVDVGFGVQDSTQFDLTLSGTGSSADPWVIGVGYATTAKLANIPDVNAPAPTNGQVLGYNTATSKWVAQAPTTAASGSVQHNTSLSGDGSVGTPLAVVPDANRFVQSAAGGIGLSNTGMANVVQHFASSAARSSMSPAAVLNQLTMLDTVPGRVDYWTGSAWAPLAGVKQVALSSAILEVSGPYAGGAVTHMMKHFTGTADGTGGVTLLSTTDLSGYAGVIQVITQHAFTGSAPLVLVVAAGIGGFAGTIRGVAYNLSGSVVSTGTTVNVYVDATVY